MSDDTSLQELVLGYCRQVDGLVEPPAYGIYEVLLPDEVAARWGMDAHQRFTFSAEADNATTNGYATFLHYGHALVETIVNELRLQTANGLFFISNVRLEKPKLYAVIEKAISVSNAKLFPVPGAAEQAHLHHYARFNFKVSLIADEKRELILPIWMDLQGGYAVKGSEIERQAILDVENQFRQLDPALPRWMDGEPLATTNGFAPKVLASLLERARHSVASELGDTLASLQKRLRHFLELDRARLNEYYTDLLKDAERRLQKADEERRPALEAKLTAIAAERQSKLEDVEQKYRLRVQLELINLAIIAQPKLDLSVEIRKRTVSVKRLVTWDPLFHAVEALVCDVCGQPGKPLSLCENGHLAHSECLAAQCVECKRTYCQKCAESVQTCAVCDRPVCVHSLARCPECGRATCHQHLNECHAEDGAPRRARSEEKSPLADAGAAPLVSSPKTGQTTGRKSAPKRETPKAKTSRPQTSWMKSPSVTGDYMNIYSDPAQGIITAYVMVKKRELAARAWELTEEGIAVNCWCEKGTLCRESGIVYRPAEPERIEGQVKSFIKMFQIEYGVPDKKIHYYHIRQQEAHGELKLKVPMRWRDPAALAKACAGFDKLKLRR